MITTTCSNNTFLKVESLLAAGKLSPLKNFIYSRMSIILTVNLYLLINDLVDLHSSLMQLQLENKQK